MPKELPYFRWFPKDAESDAKYARMTLAELGLYHRCLNHSWMNDGLPTDLSELAGELRIPLREMERHWPRVAACFSGDDRWRNPRQEIERNHARTKSKQATDAIRARHGRTTDEDTDVGSSELPRAYGSGSVSSSSPTFQTTSTKGISSLHSKSDSWFKEEFWPLWPVKIAREPTKKACRGILPHERAAVLAGIREQSARILAMERPIHGSTWVNGRRWEDDPAAVQAATARNGNGTLFPPHETVTERSIRVAKETILRDGRL